MTRQSYTSKERGSKKRGSKKKLSPRKKVKHGNYVLDSMEHFMVFMRELNKIFDGRLFPAIISGGAIILGYLYDIYNSRGKTSKIETKIKDYTRILENAVAESEKGIDKVNNDKVKEKYETLIVKENEKYELLNGKHYIPPVELIKMSSPSKPTQPGLKDLVVQKLDPPVPRIGQDYMDPPGPPIGPASESTKHWWVPQKSPRAPKLPQVDPTSPMEWHPIGPTTPINRKITDRTPRPSPAGLKRGRPLKNKPVNPDIPDIPDNESASDIDDQLEVKAEVNVQQVLEKELKSFTDVVAEAGRPLSAKQVVEGIDRAIKRANGFVVRHSDSDSKLEPEPWFKYDLNTAAGILALFTAISLASSMLGSGSGSRRSPRSRKRSRSPKKPKTPRTPRTSMTPRLFGRKPTKTKSKSKTKPRRRRSKLRVSKHLKNRFGNPA